jgi:hypothetical protein
LEFAALGKVPVAVPVALAHDNFMLMEFQDIVCIFPFFASASPAGGRSRANESEWFSLTGEELTGPSYASVVDMTVHNRVSASLG